MKIGYCNPGYPVVRNVLNKCKGGEYIRTRSIDGVICKIVERVPLLDLSFFVRYLENAFHGGFSGGRLDVLHLFNKIPTSPSRIPFVTTFEVSVPWKFPNGFLFKQGIESLCSSRCRRLIAISRCAYNDQVAVNRKYGVEDFVNPKLKVIHPPQKTIVESCNILGGGAIRCIFVGKDAFRKGAAESLRALKRLRKDIEVEVYVIGRFDHVDYASSWGVDSAAEMQRLIEANCWIHHFDSLPNEDVLKLAKTCNVGLLPTRHDTYGYSVLEFQACGIPCITTDVRALPEINNDECGWVIPVAKNGEVDLSSDEALHDLSVRIEAGVFEAFVKLANDPASAASKGAAALERIRREHDPMEFGKKLMKIYEEAVS